MLSTDGDRSTLRYEHQNSDGQSAASDFVLDTGQGYVLEITSWPYGADSDAREKAPGWSSRTTAEISVVDSAP